MILITGATGKVGGETSRALQAMKVPHRTLVRNPGRAARAANVEVVQGDLAQPESLAAALDGVDHALMISPPTPEGPQLESNFIAAAKRAGVEHVVKLSSYGAAPGGHIFGAQHAAVERELEASGLGWTMLRPNGFFQNFLGNADSIKARNAFHAPAGDMKFSTVDVRDVGAVAAHTLTEPGHQGQRYTITGPEALSHAQIAEIFTKVLGRPIAYIPVSEDDARQAMLGSGIPAWSVEGILSLFAYYRTGAAAEVTDVVQRVGRKTPITFEQFVRENAAAFKA